MDWVICLFRDFFVCDFLFLSFYAYPTMVLSVVICTFSCLGVISKMLVSPWPLLGRDLGVRQSYLSLFCSAVVYGLVLLGSSGWYIACSPGWADGLSHYVVILAVLGVWFMACRNSGVGGLLLYRRLGHLYDFNHYLPVVRTLVGWPTLVSP